MPELKTKMQTRARNGDMKVTFTRTGERRYRVSVEGTGVIASYMEPAAGYDERLPHDLAHFVVENDLGIMGCIFGPLSNGGSGWAPLDETKKRKPGKSGNPKKNLDQKEAEMTERVIDIACHKWTGRKYTGAMIKGVTTGDIDRICGKFDDVSSVWSKLRVGESMTLEWTIGSRKAR
ncbi:hypothetical protein BH10ACI2_BH10ACI2_11520 [soil metagenome]